MMYANFIIHKELSVLARYCAIFLFFYFLKQQLNWAVDGTAYQ